MNSEESAPNQVLGERSYDGRQSRYFRAIALEQHAGRHAHERARIGVSHLVLREYDDAAKPCAAERTKRIGEPRPRRDGAAELGTDRSAAALALAWQCIAAARFTAR